MIGLDEWIQGEPRCDGPPPCPECNGRGEVARPYRVWFDDKHGFDCEDEWQECVRCGGTGHEC